MKVSTYLWPFIAARMAARSSSSVSGVIAVIAIIIGLAESRAEKSTSTPVSSAIYYSYVRKVASLNT